MSLAPGTRLGPYEILSPLGAGGMGEVYRARDPRIGREVAVKVIHSALAGDAERLGRFEQEVRAAGALNHPNILSIHDVGNVEGSPYLVSELLEGETLRERLSTLLPVKKAIEFAVQIAQALAAAHDKGIIHRDLKPENIFITKDGRVKILDFGLAKLTRPDPANGGGHSKISTTPGTESGVVLGTFGYMSPEQVRGQRADARSDIFAFGAVLYEMLTGVRAFKGATPADTMSAILKEDPPEIATAGRVIPQGLERIAKHCLEKEPVERFQSARDIAFALDALTGTTSAGQQLAVTAPARSRMKALLVIAALLIAAATIAAVGIRFGRRLDRGSARVPAFKQLTFRTEMIFNARFAPDGRTVIFTSALSGSDPEIFTVSPEYPDPHSLGLKHAALLSISSKGELAVLTRATYLHWMIFTGTLARMPLGGGAPREVLEGVREADWTPDGSELAIIREVAGKDRLEFPPGQVLAETGGYFSDMRFSRDGQRIALFDHPYRYDDRGSVITVDLTGRKATLSGGWNQLEGLAWSADGREILFSGSRGDSVSVRAITPTGNTRVVVSSTGNPEIQDVAADGHLLLRSRDFRYDLLARAPGESTEGNLSWLDLSHGTDLSADGRLLLFTEGESAMGPNYLTCMRGTDGSPPVRLGEGGACGLSPDGKLALANIPTSPGRLVLYPTGAGQTRVLDRGPIVDYIGGCWFPDGKRIMVYGSEPGHAPRCYVQEIAGGPPRPVTPEGMIPAEGSQARQISPDGNFVCVRDASGRKLLAPIAGGEPKELPFLTADDVVIRWTPDGRSLLVHNRNRVPDPLDRVDVATGRRENLRMLGPADLAGAMRIRHVVAADDPRAYAYTVFRQRAYLYLVEGVR